MAEVIEVHSAPTVVEVYGAMQGEAGPTGATGPQGPAGATTITGTALSVAADGTLTWSSDTNLKRHAANVLRTNDDLTVDGQLSVGNSALVTGGVTTTTGVAAGTTLTAGSYCVVAQDLGVGSSTVRSTLPYGVFGVLSGTNGAPTVIFRGASAQTVDLLQLQDNGGTNVFKVSIAGAVTCTSLLVNGQTIAGPGAWNDITPGTDMSHSSTSNASVRTEHGGTVVRMRGRLLAGATIGSSATIGTIPSGFRPAYELRMTVRNIGSGAATNVLVINTNGTMTFGGGLASTSEIAFDGITFAI